MKAFINICLEKDVEDTYSVTAIFLYPNVDISEQVKLAVALPADAVSKFQIDIWNLLDDRFSVEHETNGTYGPEGLRFGSPEDDGYRTSISRDTPGVED